MKRSLSTPASSILRVSFGEKPSQNSMQSTPLVDPNPPSCSTGRGIFTLTPASLILASQNLRFSASLLRSSSILTAGAHSSTIFL